MSAEEKFCRAYWAFKRNQRELEPTAAEFGLHESVANGLARQCHRCFEQDVYERAIYDLLGPQRQLPFKEAV